MTWESSEKFSEGFQRCTMESTTRVNILGCPFDAISFGETVQCIKRTILEGRQIQIVPGSVDFVMKAKRDATFKRELWRADLVVADGVPIVWAATLLGEPLCGRVSGTELVWRCAEISAELGCAVALIGAKPGVAPRAAQKMSERYPHAKLHAIPTPSPLGPEDNAELIETIKAMEAKIVLAALGAPRQERWVQSYLSACTASVGIGVGSAFDIICGDMPRAPRWMQDHGLEWLQRLLLEPRRLGRRYLIEDSPFIFHLACALVRQKARGSTS
jgi:N-acetylglucosaminyldiphosphoundecaprenol N-acetyl-beta-D-mannosaminyltransferase